MASVKQAKAKIKAMLEEEEAPRRSYSRHDSSNVAYQRHDRHER